MKMAVYSDAMLSERAKPKLMMSTEMTSARMTQIMAEVMVLGKKEKVARQII